MDAARSALRVEKDAAGTQGTADYLRGHKFSEHVTKASSDSEASPEGRHATSSFRMADDAGVYCTSTRIGKAVCKILTERSCPSKSGKPSPTRLMAWICGLSFPSFGRRVTFSELLRQVFSLWLRQVSSLWLRQVFSFWLRQVSSLWLRQVFSLWPRLQPEPAIPAAAVSECDGGHGAAAGCARLLLPSAAECLQGFGARPRGIPESF